MSKRRNKKVKMNRSNAYLEESLQKSFVTDEVDSSKLSNNPATSQITKELSDDSLEGVIVVDSENYYQNQFDFSQGLDRFTYQNKVIDSYRNLVKDVEVSNGVDIIINELIYTTNPDVLKIDIDEENEKISEAINDGFKRVLDVLNIKDNIFNIARQMYIDGQLNVSLSYLKNDLSAGIVSSYILEPKGLYFDKSDRKWKYNSKVDENITSFYNTEEDLKLEEFTESELVHVDYGLYSKIYQDGMSPYVVNLGYLEKAFTAANMLKTLENMLVPARYSRSVSRRLFNIDVGDLPPKQAKQLMDKIRAEFRYKKRYDPKTGTITNMNNTQPLVEDFWMSNRGGSKGTTVDTMDERGGLLEMDDIKHAAKKLYTSMNIPDEMNPYSDDLPSFGFDDTQVSQNFLRFYIFVSRLRTPITKLIKEILRRDLVSRGIFKDSEWKNYEGKINIEFTAESAFLETMKKQIFLQNISAFDDVKEHVGKLISLETAVNNTFGWSSEQLADEFEKIEDEKLSSKFKVFYASQDAEDNWN